VARFQACVAVYGLLFDVGAVLLMRRAGTGYRDGELGLPAGHLDGDESAPAGLRRELREELGVEAHDVSLATVMHRRRETPDDVEYLDLFFLVDGWSGTPRAAEPDKCDELVWAPVHALPDDVVDYVRDAIDAITAGRPLTIRGWD
jgi:ADP-ribose pyrophosphatase YjhB (NUDIX family)